MTTQIFSELSALSYRARILATVAQPGQDPYAETRLTESHIFSVEIFSHGLSLSVFQTFLISRTWCWTVLTTVMCGGPQLSLSPCLCQTSLCGRSEIIPALQLSSVPTLSSLPAECGRNWARRRAALQIIALFELRLTALGFTDNETMNIKLKLNIQCG